MIGVYRCLACPTGGRRRRSPGQEIPYIGFWGVAGSAGYKYPRGVRQIPAASNRRRGKRGLNCPRGTRGLNAREESTLSTFMAGASQAAADSHWHIIDADG